MLTSEYRLNANSTIEEVKDEIIRKARQEAENFDPNWYPNQWLSFYLFGLPAHGTDVCFATLTYGKHLKDATSADMHQALSDLNTEAANNSLRRKVNSDKTGPSKSATVSLDIAPQKNLVVTHNFQRPKGRRREIANLEKAFELLKGDDFYSDEEVHFSKKQNKQDVGLALLDNLLNATQDDEDEE